MSDFQTSVDVGNRGLQHVGQARMTSLTQDYKGAAEVAFCIDKVRKAELQRNAWRFSIKNVALRAIDANTMTLVPAAYDAAKTYIVGSVVIQSGAIYLAVDAIPISTPPADNPSSWVPYYGPLTVSLYDSTIGYYSGEVVYTPQAAGTYHVYLSLVSDNTADPTAVPAYDAAVIYNKGDTVTYLTVVYQSTLDLNVGTTPTGVAPWITVPATQPVRMQGQDWIRLNATVASSKIIYPLGAGPRNQSTTRNIYRLPAGYLKKAPQDPKSGSVSFLGAPSGMSYDDWDFQGDYLITRDIQVIVLRFIADISDVTKMTPMFCEGWACRIAAEVCETLTQSTEKLTVIASAYKTFMGEARLANAIEIGSEEPAEDDYITCRM